MFNQINRHVFKTQYNDVAFNRIHCVFEWLAYIFEHLLKPAETLDVVLYALGGDRKHQQISDYDFDQGSLLDYFTIV